MPTIAQLDLEIVPLAPDFGPDLLVPVRQKHDEPLSDHFVRYDHVPQFHQEVLLRENQIRKRPKPEVPGEDKDQPEGLWPNEDPDVDSNLVPVDQITKDS